MKYILMCGGNYSDKFETPKQLLKVNGEILVERTIRLLKENGIKDIAISTNNPAFNYLNVEILKHKNQYTHDNPNRNKNSINSWLNAYYPIDTPCCYLHGDVYFSEEAIKTIVETPVKDTMFFCVRDISDGRLPGINIKGREPLAYKVENQKVFRNAINELLKMIDDGKFKEDPVSWNVYRQINGLELDFKAEPFGSMPELMCIATKVDKLHAVCMKCGGDHATRTQRLIDGKPADKNINTLNTLLGSASLKPAQKKADEFDGVFAQSASCFGNKVCNRFAIPTLPSYTLAL